MEAITKVIDVILFPIAEPVKLIVDAILKLVEFVVLLVTAIPEVLSMAIQIFNPVAVLNDVIAGTFLGLKIILKSVGDIFKNGPNFKYDKCKDSGEGIFGFRRARDENGNLTEILNKNTKKRTCVEPTFINLLIMVLCPPLALFFHLGVRGWFQILVCAFLTVKTYYFPGLIYAVMHLIC
jgi:uncharacterized membrane protein YqaE (UPF0057 family)